MIGYRERRILISNKKLAPLPSKGVFVVVLCVSKFSQNSQKKFRVFDANKY